MEGDGSHIKHSSPSRHVSRHIKTESIANLYLAPFNVYAHAFELASYQISGMYSSVRINTRMHASMLQLYGARALFGFC